MRDVKRKREEGNICIDVCRTRTMFLKRVSANKEQQEEEEEEEEMMEDEEEDDKQEEEE